MKNFHYKFLRIYESSKVGTWYTFGQWAVVLCIPESGPRALTLVVTSLDMFYKFPLISRGLKVYQVCQNDETRMTFDLLMV